MESMNVMTLWEENFPEFVKVGEAGINSLMVSAKVVELSAGQQIFTWGLFVNSIY